MTLFHKRIIRHQIRDALLYWLFIPLVVILSGLVIDFLLGLQTLPTIPPLLPALLIFLGLLLIYLSIRDLTILGQGTPNPRCPPKILVTGHTYSLCRHPMFLGYDMAALGVIMLFASAGMTFISFPVFIFLQIRFLRQEEVTLARRFRSSHAEYRRGVPFFLPSLRLFISRHRH